MNGAYYTAGQVNGGGFATDITIRHNTLYNNGEEELKTKITGADLVIKNNIFHANGASAAISIPAGSGPLPSEDYNLVYNDGPSTEGGSQSQVTSFGPNTIVGMDPQFVNPGIGDLHLMPSSPALGAGTDLGVVDDIDGNVRPDPSGSNPDLGCHELAGPVTVEPTSWSAIKARRGSGND